METFLQMADKLERLETADRRLDSEVVAAVLGPPDCTIDSLAGLDGWDIETAPNEDGEATVWLEAADVGHITHLIEDAFAFVGKVRPDDGALVLACALRTAPPPPAGATIVRYAQRLSCWIVAETLRALARDSADHIGRPHVRAA